MKVIASGKTDKFTFALKLSDERLKLFIDLEVVPPKPVEAPAADPASATKDTKASATPAIKEKIEPVPVSKEDILAILPKEVWDGAIHHDVIETIAKELSHGKKIEERRVAKGTAAVDGKDGRFVLTVKKMSPKAEMQEDQKGFVDFKDLHRFENIRVGTIVGKIFAASAGVPGTDPLGKPLTAKNGQECKLSFNETIESKAHAEGGGQDLVAKIDGFLLDEGGKLSIQEELKVSGSIDYKVGSIDFVGTVLIQGDVLPGFVVRGKKGVVVKGSVQEATVCSSEGAVQISGHCMGSISTKIEAKTELSLSVANQVEAQAGIILNIAKEARGCQLRAGGIISGKKAAIIGGEAYCGCGVEAREIGSRGGSKTSINLSNDVAMSKEFTQNQQLIADHEKILAMLNAHLGPLAKTNAGLNSLSEQHRQRLMPMVNKKRAIETSLIELKLKREELLSAAHVNHMFRVNFLESMHTGVEVVVGEEIYTAQEEATGPKSLTFNSEKKAFEFSELAELECSIVEQSKENSNDTKKHK